MVSAHKSPRGNGLRAVELAFRYWLSLTEGPGMDHAASSRTLTTARQSAPTWAT